MKRIRRFAAMLLSAAMVMTSIQVPVYAAQDENAVIEQEDLQESETPAEDLTEELFDDEEPVKETPAEPSKEAEEAQAEPEKEEEFTEVPLEGDTEESISSENFEEIVVGQSDEESDEALDESVTGNDDTLYVGNAKEFLKALKEAGEKKDSKGKAVPAVIELREPNYDLVTKLDGKEDYKNPGQVQKDFAAYDAENFLINKSILGDQKMEIPAGADVTIKGNGHSIRFADDAADDAVMKVAAGASLTLENKASFTWGEDDDDYSVTITGTYGFQIENSGTFNAKNVKLTSAKAVAFENKAKGFASFEGSTVEATTTPMDGVAAIHNEAEAELVLGGTKNGSQSAMSEISVEINKASAILNEGSLIINNAKIFADGTDSCAVFNNGEKAELSVRGGFIISTQSVAIYNTAKLEIGSQFAYDKDVTIEARGSVPAVLSPGGSVIVRCANEPDREAYGYPVTIIANDAFAVSTTANVLDPAAKQRYPGTGDGSFTMFGGIVDGIAYAGENYPTVLGGTVHKDGGACVPIKADGALEDDVTKAHYYWYDTAEEKPERQLKNAYTGTAFDDTLNLPKGSDAAVGDYWKTVGPDVKLSELVKAKAKYIRIPYSYPVTLEEPLVLDYDVTIQGYGSYNYNYGIIYVSGANTITIAKDANVVLENLKIGGADPLIGDAPKVIANAGNLTLKNVDINYYSIQNISVDSNAKVRVLDNTGTVIMTDNLIDYYGRPESSSGTIRAVANGTAVHNNGTFIMQNGRIMANGEGSYAILYEGENLPILVRGEVEGTGYKWESQNADIDKITSPDKAAVAKWDGTEAVTGEFKNTTDANASKLPTKDSTYIKDGVAQEVQNLENAGVVPDEYLLMEVGELIEETNIKSIFKTDSKYTNAVLRLSSPTEDVGIVETKNDPLTITAKGKGHTIVTFGLYDSEKEDARLIITNYLRIDVVNKGRRAELVSDHYTGNIINPNIVVNGYKTKSNEPVKFEFHMTDSYGDEVSTGADNFEAIVNGTYNVDGILIDDKEFKEYFSTDKRYRYGDDEGDDDEANISTYYDSEKKLYAFDLQTLQEDGRKAQQGGLATKLMVDDCRKIDNIKVSVVLKDASGRTIIVPIGAFNISVKSAAPKFKVDAITINRFYTNRYIANVLYNDEGYNYTITNDPYEYISELGAFSVPAGVEVDTDGDITISGKKGGKVSSSVVVSNYVGRYPFSATIKVTNKAPKVSLKEKKISIYGKTSAETDIYTALTAKGSVGEDDLDNVAEIKVVGKSAEFYKAGVLSYPDTIDDGKTWFRNFALQPKKAVTKAMTVDLEVSFTGARKVKGKPYVVKLKLKVSPVDYNKFSVKQTTKVRLNKTPLEGNIADYTKVSFSLNPRTYKGGKFIVTGLNGKGNAANPLPESLSFGSVVDNGNGNYSVQVTANDKTKDEKAKAVKFAVQLIAPNEQGEFVSVLKKQAVMTVNLYDAKEPAISKTDATIDMSKVKAADIEKLGSSVLSSKLKATYKVTGAVGNWSVNDDSALFNTIASINKNGDITSIGLIPDSQAYYAGRIQVGNKYTVNVTFDNQRGTRVVKEVTVSVKDVKKADAVIYKYNEDDDPIKKNEFTLYYNSPYTLDNFWIGEIANRDSIDCSTAPYMGLTVKDVTVDESKGTSPYEVIKYRSADGDHYEYALTFKDKAKTTDAATLKKAKTVTLKITYSNGLTDDYFGSKPCLKKVKVNIPDLPKK